MNANVIHFKNKYQCSQVTAEVPHRWSRISLLANASLIVPITHSYDRLTTSSLLSQFPKRRFTCICAVPTAHIANCQVYSVQLALFILHLKRSESGVSFHTRTNVIFNYDTLSVLAPPLRKRQGCHAGPITISIYSTRSVYGRALTQDLLLSTVLHTERYGRALTQYLLLSVVLHTERYGRALPQDLLLIKYSITHWAFMVGSIAHHLSRKHIIFINFIVLFQLSLLLLSNTLLLFCNLHRYMWLNMSRPCLLGLCVPFEPSSRARVAFHLMRGWS